MRSKAKQLTSKLYSVSEAAEMLNMKVPQILYRIKTGKIKADKIGWFWAIPKEEIDDLIDED